MTNQDRRALYGVGGWLRWWINVSLFITPLSSLGSYMKSKGEFIGKAVPEYIYLIGIALLIETIWQVVVALNLKYRLVPASRTMAITFHFLSPVLGFVYLEMVMGAYGLSIIGDSLAGPALVKCIWGTYFIRSKRCKNTYGI